MDSYNWHLLTLTTKWRPFRHPFVLNGTVKNLLGKSLLDNQKKDVFIKLVRDLYADDVTISFDSINEGIQFYEISKSCLLKGQFALRKQITNDQNVQLFIDAKENENFLQNGTYLKVLGLHCFTENDTFEYNFTDIIILAEVLPTAKSNILKISAIFYGHQEWFHQ